MKNTEPHGRMIPKGTLERRACREKTISRKNPRIWRGYSAYTEINAKSHQYHKMRMKKACEKCKNQARGRRSYILTDQDNVQ
jgi:hypothetical protein